jgi:RNA polymerase sigma-32 factor
MAKGNIPVFQSGDGGLSRYLEEIRRFPMLEPQEEYMLAKRYNEHGDRDAAHRLVTSHLRLVAKIAMGYRGYGLPIGEVISEGNVGLMQAVKRFEPDKGFRLATLRHVVDKGGHPGIHPALLEPGKDGDDRQPEAALLQLAQGEELDPGARRGGSAARSGGANRSEAERQRGRGGLHEPASLGDASLNAPIRATEGDSGEWQDWLADDAETQETVLAEQDELDQRRAMLKDALMSSITANGASSRRAVWPTIR